MPAEFRNRNYHQKFLVVLLFRDLKFISGQASGCLKWTGLIFKMPDMFTANTDPLHRFDADFQMEIGPLLGHLGI